MICCSAENQIWGSELAFLSSALEPFKNPLYALGHLLCIWMLTPELLLMKDTSVPVLFLEVQ